MGQSPTTAKFMRDPMDLYRLMMIKLRRYILRVPGRISQLRNP